MGENSGIQWTTHTMNPWVGCVKISPGCDHCYAETYDKRVGGIPVKQRENADVPELRWGPKGKRNRTKGPWLDAVRWNAAAAAKGERARVFCASLADVFEDNARFPLDRWRLELFDLIARTPWLDWQLLTKRPHAIRRHLSAAIDAFPTTPGCAAGEALLQAWVNGEPPSNVWLGTTIEDQKRAHERVPELLKVPAVVRFLSMEPLLERVDLDQPGLIWRPCTRCKGSWSVPVPGGGRACPDCFKHQGAENAGIDWVIIGGESGHGARPFELNWARELVRQAREFGAAPFVKQLGAAASDARNGLAGRSLEVPADAAALVSRRLVDPAGGDMDEWPEDLRVREFPVVRTR